jgi:hypothetical protein
MCSSLWRSFHVSLRDDYVAWIVKKNRPLKVRHSKQGGQKVLCDSGVASISRGEKEISTYR